MKKQIQRLFIAIVAMMVLPLGIYAQDTSTEASWGVSSSELTDSGTLEQAIAAAAADTANVKYIRLQQDVTTTTGHIIKAGVFTLDLNGHTLTKDGYTLDIRNEGTLVTLTDNSAEGTGQVISTSSGASAVVILEGAKVIIEKGIYEGSNAVKINTETLVSH